MVIVTPQSDYDCMQIAMEDPDCRITIHAHRFNEYVEIRQIKVATKFGNVIQKDIIDPRDYMPCDHRTW